jgi:hypothetical protein
VRYSKLAVEAPLEVPGKSGGARLRRPKISQKVGKNPGIPERPERAEKTMKGPGPGYPQNGRAAEKTMEDGRKLGDFFGIRDRDFGPPKKPPQDPRVNAGKNRLGSGQLSGKPGSPKTP